MVGELAHLHMFQVAEAAACIFPHLQLAVEVPRHAAVLHDVFLALQHLLAGFQLHGAQAVLVEVVGIDALYAQGGIAVASPPAAQIQFVVYTPYAVTPREGQSEGIVLAVRRVGELYLPYQRRKESARCTQSVDTQCVVAAVVLCPLAVVDDARRQRVQVEVAHAVGAYYHGGFLFMECIHYLLQCLGRRIEVVTVELNGKLAAHRTVHRHIPAAANAQVAAFGHDVEKTRHLGGCILFLYPAYDGFEYLACMVSGVVVHHDDIKPEAGLLAEGTLHSIGDGFLTVVHGYDNRSLILKFLLRKVGLPVEMGIHQCPHLVEVLRTCLLHLHLHLAIARVYIVKLLLAALPCVQFHLSVKALVQMEKCTATAQEQSQVIESGILVVGTVLTGGIVFQRPGLDKP